MSRKTKTLEFENATYDIQITGRHVEITESMKEHFIDKFAKIERILDRILDVNVILDIQKLDHRAEVILKAGNIKISSTATSSDMYVSIDQAIDKLEAQILRYKSKMQDHHAKAHHIVDMEVNILNPNEMEDEFESGEFSEKQNNRFKPHKVVNKETRPLKILTYDEALMKMELSRDSFMLFKNEADQKLKVIYRREDGNYGIIEPTC